MATKLETTIATLDKYIGNLRRVKTRTAAQDKKLATYVERRATLQRRSTNMAGAHLTDAQYADIGAAFTKYITANNKASVEVAEWPAVLGDKLFAAAIKGGYFGPPGTVPGLDYGDGTQEGAQVRITQPDDGSPAYAELFVDGKVVAREDTGSPGGFDTVAFAKKHGQSI